MQIVFLNSSIKLFSICNVETRIIAGLLVDFTKSIEMTKLKRHQMLEELNFWTTWIGKVRGDQSFSRDAS